MMSAQFKFLFKNPPAPKKPSPKAQEEIQCLSIGDSEDCKESEQVPLPPRRNKQNKTYIQDLDSSLQSEIDVDKEDDEYVPTEVEIQQLVQEEKQEEVKAKKLTAKVHEYILQEHQTNKNTVSVQLAASLLRFAEEVKKALPNYSLASIICGLQKKVSHLDFSIPNDFKFQEEQQAQEEPPASKKKQADNRSVHLTPSSCATEKPTPKPGQKFKQREQLQKQVAHIFILKGYGYHLSKPYFTHTISNNIYSSLLTSIFRAALRKLCDIMNRNLNQNIKQFQMQQEYILRSPLANCRKWLTRSEQKTLFKIINIVYSMNTEPIYQDEVLAFYDKMLRQLYRRNANYKEVVERKKEHALKPHNPPNFNRFQTVFNPARLQENNIETGLMHSKISWTSQRRDSHSESEFRTSQLAQSQRNYGYPQAQDKNPLIDYQKEIAQCFARFCNLDSVLQILSKKHPHIHWNMLDLRDIISKLVKIGLKKLSKCRKQFFLQRLSVPQLSLTEHTVNHILSSPFAEESRVQIVKSLFERNYTLTRTNQIINMVNSAMKRIESSR